MRIEARATLYDWVEFKVECGSTVINEDIHPEQAADLIEQLESAIDNLKGLAREVDVDEIFAGTRKKVESLRIRG